jgi:hypothetical protein
LPVGRTRTPTIETKPDLAMDLAQIRLSSHRALLLCTLAAALAACTETRLELDKMAGTAFPGTVTVDGEVVTIPRIFARGDVLIVVDEDQTAIAPLAGVDCLDAAASDALVLANRQSPIDSDTYSCYGFTCTRHHVYGIIADHLNCGDATVAGETDTANRESFVVYFAHPNISISATQHSEFTLLRTAAHELGHAFNLHHADNVGQTLMLTGSGTTNLVLSNLSRTHLRDHPDDKKYPATGLLGDVIAAHQAAHVAGAPPEPGFADLTLNVGLDHSVVVPGEPVWLTLTLTNRSGRPQSLYGDLRLEGGAAEILVTGPDGREEPFVPLRADLVIKEPERLAPGEGRSASVAIFFGGRGWTFTRPGAYRLRARYRDPITPGISVASQAVELRVEAGTEAGRGLIDGGEASWQAGKYLLWQAGDHLASGIALLDELIQEEPGSALAHYARLARGIALARDFPNYLEARVRPADCPQALSYLEAVDAERLAVTARVRKALHQASCYSRLERFEEAVAQLSAARDQAAGNPALEQSVERAIEADPRRERWLLRAMGFVTHSMPEVAQMDHSPPGTTS